MGTRANPAPPGSVEAKADDLLGFIINMARAGALNTRVIGHHCDYDVDVLSTLVSGRPG